MHTVDKSWVNNHIDEILSAIKRGDILIYPTDTIYGIGCDALNTPSIENLRALKQRPDKPFSIIAPSKKWIEEHFFVPPEALDMLPGPVTLILEPKDPTMFSPAINPNGSSIGVRIPDHWFNEIIQKAGIPFITTSVNLSDNPHMTSIDDIPASIEKSVTFCVYEGPIHGHSSKKFDFTNH